MAPATQTVSFPGIPNGGSVCAAVQPIGNGLQQSWLTGLM